MTDVKYETLIWGFLKLLETPKAVCQRKNIKILLYQLMVIAVLSQTYPPR